MPFDIVPPAEFRSQNARGTLIGQLYSPTDQLQVTPRRRFISTVNISVPAGSSAVAAQTFPVLQDILQAGDGLLIDLVQFIWTPPAVTNLLSLSSVFLQAVFQPGFGLATLPAQALITTLTPSIGGATGVLAVTPALLTSLDLNNLRTGVGGPLGPLPLGAMPLQFINNLQFFNATAGALLVSTTGTIWVRIVRGLEEA